MNRLPVINHAAGVLADEIVADFQRAGGTGLGVVLEHLAPAGDAGIGEILTNTQEFFRTNVSILVTLMLSFGPTAAASVRSAVNIASRPNSSRGAE